MKTGDIDHEIEADGLPERNEQNRDKGEPGFTQPTELEDSPSGALSQGFESLHEDELPDKTDDNKAEDIRNKERGSQPVGRFQLHIEDQRQQNGQYVDQDNV
ncbi:hypothetical protein D1872_309750 [compost metagenome]